MPKVTSSSVLRLTIKPEDNDGTRPNVEFKHPIVNGVIEDWESMEKLWNQTFQEKLRVHPSELEGVVLTEKPLNT